MPESAESVTWSQFITWWEVWGFMSQRHSIHTIRSYVELLPYTYA